MVDTNRSLEAVGARLLLRDTFRTQSSERGDHPDDRGEVRIEAGEVVEQQWIRYHNGGDRVFKEDVVGDNFTDVILDTAEGVKRPKQPTE